MLSLPSRFAAVILCFAALFGVEELHALLGLDATVHVNSVSRRGRRRHAAAGIPVPRQPPAQHHRRFLMQN